VQFVLQNLFVHWLGYRVRGLEHLPRGGALLLINHQSYLDPLLVGAALQRPVSYLARENLFRVPVIGWILRNTYVMPIRREAASSESLREALKRIDQGYLVGVFPEGTRTKNGQMGPLKPGFLALVRRVNCPIIPVGIEGAFEVLPRGVFFPRPRRVRVVIGEPIPQQLLADHNGREGERELVHLVSDRIEACRREAAAWRTEAD
jgi:1-acyl-sn-glycerol-3-phosphate acyltransferase